MLPSVYHQGGRGCGVHTITGVVARVAQPLALDSGIKARLRRSSAFVLFTSERSQTMNLVTPACSNKVDVAEAGGKSCCAQ